MNIQTLKIRNFYGIVEADYTFSTGIVNISGPNGSGKTSIVKALELIFLNETEENLAECIHWDADSFSLECEFTLHGKQFAYEISSDGKKTERNLIVDGQNYINSDATDIIRSFFHPTLTRASVFAMQGEDDLVNTKPAARRDHLRQVYDLDFSEQKAKLEESKDKEKEELQKIENQIIMLENKEYDERKLYDLPFDHSIRMEKQTRIDNIDIETSSFNEALRNWDEKNSRLQQFVEQRAKKNSQLQDTMKQLDLANQELRSVPQKTEEKRASKRKMLDDINSELEGITLTRLKPFDSDALDEAKKDSNSFSAQAQMVAQQLIKISDEDNCPVCGSPISDEHVKELQDECDALKQKADEAKTRVNELTKEWTSYTEKKERNDALSQKKASLLSKRENLERELSDIDEHRVLLEEVAQKKIDMAQEKIDELTEEIETLDPQIESLRNETEGKKPVQDAERSSERAALKKEIEEYDRMTIWNEEAESYNKELETKKTQDAIELQNLSEQKAKIQHSIREYTEAAQIVSTLLPSYIISQMVQGLESNVNEFLRLTYPKYKVQIQETKKALKIVYGPAEKDVRHASGFERQIFSFSYKHALSQIQGTSLLILDEVDAFADDSNSEKFYEALGTMSELYEQMFVITHRSVAKDLLEREFGSKEIEL